MLQLEADKEAALVWIFPQELPPGFLRPFRFYPKETNCFETAWKASLVFYGTQSSGLQCWIITYHPGLAAEVVDGVERVDGVEAAVLEADDEAAEIFPQSHAVGVLPDQDKIWLEGPARDEQRGVSLSNAPEGLLNAPCFFSILPLSFH